MLAHVCSCQLETPHTACWCAGGMLVCYPHCCPQATHELACIHTRGPHLVRAGARVWPCRHDDASVACFGVDDLHVHHAGAQTQELQVVPNDCVCVGGERSSPGGGGFC